MEQKTINWLLLIVAILIIAGTVAHSIENWYQKNFSHSSEGEKKANSLLQLNEEQERDLQAFQTAMAESMRIAMAEEKERLLKESIKVLNVYPSKPNSVGGVDVHTVWKNTSNKVIKYITFQWAPYNAVGDIVSCTVRGYRIAGGTVTGPVQPGQTYGYGYQWSNTWYNNTIKMVKLIEIDIEYMDGSKLNIPTQYIEYVYKKQEY